VIAFVFVHFGPNIRSSAPMRIGGIRSGADRPDPPSYAADAHRWTNARSGRQTVGARIAPRSYAADAHQGSDVRMGAGFREFEARDEAAGHAAGHAAGRAAGEAP
jgi:hypothetical protein